MSGTARPSAARRADPRALALPAAGLALAAAIVLSAGQGALSIPAATTLGAILDGLLGRPLDAQETIVWSLRLPRVLMGALVGASLGAAGAALQGLFRNPLADPYLTGAASGAALGATLAIAGAGSLTAAGLSAGPTPAFTPLFAFAGATLATLATLALARAGRRGGTESLVLAGVVVGSVLTALTTLVMLRDAERLRAVLAWTLGNLSLAGWPEVGRTLPFALAGVGGLVAVARGLDAVQLGDDTARTLGLSVGRLRVAVVALASLATAAAVALAGVIGFVGLVAPHVMRRVGPPGHRALVPAAALGGATLLVLADLGARTLVRPAELPVGVVTTLLGGPFFLWLLGRRR